MVLDKFPQPLKFQIAGPNATDDLNNEIVFPLILPRAESANKRIVTEITKIQYDLGGCIDRFFGAVESQDQTEAGIRILVHYNNNVTAAENDERLPTLTIGDENAVDVLHVSSKADYNLSTSGVGTYNLVYDSLITHYLADTDGRGLIFPGDKLYISISTANNLSSHTIGVAIYYRQRLVGLTEFLGILAGRQQHS